MFKIGDKVQYNEDDRTLKRIFGEYENYNDIGEVVYCDLGPKMIRVRWSDGSSGNIDPIRIVHYIEPNDILKGML